MSTPHPASAEPNPALIMQTLCAFQQTQALKAAIELDIFTHIADGANTPKEIAEKAGASERGTRILCDYLTVIGYLTKNGGAYGLSPTAAVFLNKHSPAYLGSAANFLAHPAIMSSFNNIAGAARRGGALGDETVSPDNPIWVEFAKSMAPFTGMSAELVAQKVGP